MKFALNNITKKYNDTIIINNFSYQFDEKGIYVLSGPSGVGKTTVLRIIAGLIIPDSGDVFGFKDSRISYVFQEDRLLPWLKLLENVSCVMKDKNVIENNELAMDLLKSVNLENAFDKYPDELSGGMRRRAALARALAYNGDVFLMDEPFTGIEDELKIKLIELIKETCKDKLVIVVTHDKEESLLLSGINIVI